MKNRSRKELVTWLRHHLNHGRWFTMTCNVNQGVIYIHCTSKTSGSAFGCYLSCFQVVPSHFTLQEIRRTSRGVWKCHIWAALKWSDPLGETLSWPLNRLVAKSLCAFSNVVLCLWMGLCWMKTACPQMLISTFFLVAWGFCLAGPGLVAGPASSWASSKPLSGAKSDGIPLGET